MFGFRYIKFDSNTYVFRYVKGRLIQEGRGLSFLYFSPTNSIVAVPAGSNDIPIIFQDSTLDFQTVTIQGQITYRIDRPKLLADQLDFTVDPSGRYKNDETDKLYQRLTNAAQTATSAFIKGLTLKQAIRSAKETEDRILAGLTESQAISSMGIVPTNVSIVAIRPTPEMERALEAQTREALQQEADQAIYTRRNFAVEQERQIRESELNTEIAVEEKKRQIAEKQMEAETQATENERKLREMRMQADIAVEEQRRRLIELQTENERKAAETRGYVLETTLKPYRDLDWKTIMALNSKGDAREHIAIAFRELAEQAPKISNLQITPDLLNNIIGNRLD